MSRSLLGILCKHGKGDYNIRCVSIGGFTYITGGGVEYVDPYQDAYCMVEMDSSTLQ